MSAWERVDAEGGVLLRRPVADDAAGVLAVHGDPRVYEHDPDLTQTDLQQATVFLRDPLEYRDRWGFGFGTVLVPLSWWPEGEPGPLPGDDDRGLAGRVLDAAVRMAPSVAPGVDLVVRTRPANGAARRVAERGGFVDEGLEPGTDDLRLLRLRAPAPAG